MIGPTNANARYIKAISSSTNDHVVTFNGTGGNSVKDSGKTIGVSIPTPNTSTDVGMSLVVQSDGSLAYGVLPGNYVTLDTAQTITGLKTINNANTQDAFHIVNTRLVFQNQNIPDITTAPTADRGASYISFSEASGGIHVLGSVGYLQRANGDGETYLTARRYSNNNTETFTLISHAADSGGHMTGPYRTYNTANTNDVVTIGMLNDTSNALTFKGTKYTEGNFFWRDPTHARNDTFSERTWMTPQMRMLDKSNNENARIQVMYDTSGKHELHVCAADSSGTEKTLVISSAGYVTAPYRTSNISTDDVLTAGNGVTLGTTQTISGAKTFTSSITASGGVVGNLTGTASKATGDEDGTNIKTYYAKKSEVPNITVSDQAPTGGSNGDIWIQY